MKHTWKKAATGLLAMALVVGAIPANVGTGGFFGEIGTGITAYAETETLLTTITATGKEQASYSTENIATVSFSYTANGSSAYLNNGKTNWGWWGYGWTATVTPVEGYTITKCVFYDDKNRTATDSEAPFVVETTESDKTPQVNGTPILASQSKGITKIEVYGYAAPTTVDVTDITLNKSSTTLTVGDKETLTATVAPDDATDKTVKWSVNNTNVKLYSDSACTTEVGTDAVSVMTVYAKGKSAGNATITVTSNADNTKTASCNITVNPLTYEVVWKNYDGTILETDNAVVKDTTPTYDGETPVKPADEQYTYTFSGWSPAVSPATANAEYTAQYIKYTKHPAVAATCTTAGNSEYYEGSDGKFYNKSGDTYTEIAKNSWVIPAKGHNYGAPVWTWTDTTSASATFTCANDTSHVQTETAEITSAVKDGKMVYTAKVTFNDTEYTDTKNGGSVDTITIGDNANGYDTIDNSAHTFEAYQIFSADLSKVDDKTVLTNLDWGANVTIKNNDTNATAFLADLQSAGTALGTDKFSTLTYESGKSQKFANDIALILQSDANDTPEAKAFAQAVSKYLTGTALPSTDNKITISDAGYYLVQDASGSPTDNTAKTRYILCVADTVTVQTKVSMPRVVKKVKENTDVSDYEYQTDAVDEDYNDIADYNIGDSVPFKLYGTLPTAYADYKQYYYKFTDTLDSQFDAPAVGDITVKIDGKTVTSGVDVKVSGSVITVEFADLKATGDNAVKDSDGAITITKDSLITVEYNAVLNKNAVIGLTGQRNKVSLTYSNNPNQESGGTPDTSTTTEDGVIVFTYEVDINKIDSDTSAKLAGAYFAVKNSAGAYLLKDANGKWTTATAITFDEDSYSGAGDGSDGVFKSDANGKIELRGLDSGTYSIVELKAPAGYSKLDEEIKVTVTPTYATDRQNWTFGTDDTSAGNALKALVIKYDKASAETLSNDAGATATSGTGTVIIGNHKGVNLPSTGGMGTILFYTVGGVLVVGAGVTLITKKRMKKDES